MKFWFQGARGGEKASETVGKVKQGERILNKIHSFFPGGSLILGKCLLPSLSLYLLLATAPAPAAGGGGN